jgi:hypothetical protein
MDKRRFLGIAGAALAAPALAQTEKGGALVMHKPGTDDLGRVGSEAPKKAPRRKARTTKLFLAPPSWPNAISVEPGKGFWVQEQRHDGDPEKAWLLDFTSGKVLKTVVTNSKNTSGGVWGGGYIWSGANGISIRNHPNPPVNGIFQTGMDGKQVSWRQIPFGPKDDGGSCHGMAWEAMPGSGGKLWIYANRLESLVRIDPKSWQVDWMIPVTREVGRLHGITYDSKGGGVIWQVCGSQDPKVIGYEGYTPGLVKYDIKTGAVLEIVDFVPGSCDIHDVTIKDGQLYGVDAGEHPGWPIEAKYERPGFPGLNSPSAGYVFRIDLI